jgi:hypothetical protein
LRNPLRGLHGVYNLIEVISNVTDFRQILQNIKDCWSGFRVVGLVLGFVYLLTIVSFVVPKLFKD